MGLRKRVCDRCISEAIEVIHEYNTTLLSHQLPGYIHVSEYAKRV